MSVCRGHSLPTSASLYQCDSDEMEAERMAEDQMEVHPKQVGIVGRGAIQTAVQMADISYCWAVLLGRFLSFLGSSVAGLKRQGDKRIMSTALHREPEMRYSELCPGSLL